MSHSNTPPVRNGAPLTARSSSIKVCIGSRAPHREQYSKTGRITPKASLKKWSIMEHSPGLTQDTKSLSSCPRVIIYSYILKYYLFTLFVMKNLVEKWFAPLFVILTTYLDTWRGFEAAKTAPFPSRGIYHFGKFLEPLMRWPSWAFLANNEWAPEICRAQIWIFQF